MSKARHPSVSPPHVGVIGAGAAGMTAALRAAESGARVTLLNAHPKIGLKILMSGGTRCNVTHREVNERDFNGGSRAFVARVLRAFDVPGTLAWFAQLGVELKLEPTGKYFPMTDDAQTVLDALLAANERAGVRIESGARAVRIRREVLGGSPARLHVGIQDARFSAEFGPAVARVGEEHWSVPDREPDRWLEADRLVLATGGLSFPRTGSDGVGYALALALGHTLVSPVPALTPLTADDPWCRSLQGLACEAELRLYEGSKRLVSTRGSLLFAHFGYTGPVALDLSRHWHRAARDAAPLVVASFTPGESEESLRRSMIEAAEREPRVSVRAFLSRSMPERLAAEVCREIGVDGGSMLGQLPRADRRTLVERVLRRPMSVTGTLGYEKAEVTAGGVRLSEVNPSTLESRLVPGLYLCGEILDVEGRLGGFNFQWAWSSGTVAGCSASA
ncbi:MAG: aminoacetone oxidase family FAD-binding enzyme [Candidatus Rokuibacteriota bacterium]|nr:MAG: aminoacetone oxidase family FAD-binding enzyme [Candidatus Rokubacteria bacterium]